MEEVIDGLVTGISIGTIKEDGDCTLDTIGDTDLVCILLEFSEIMAMGAGEDFIIECLLDATINKLSATNAAGSACAVFGGPVN
mmetsp:Transcript_55224/g.87570  ORF Transcript_55224/g.87570 Transcript_55224/m.87570 type:complete len:84 (-) Transcript_55224:825-1076(-)